MHQKNTQNIIRSFYRKRFTEDTQLRFRAWFRAEDGQSGKEKTMEKLWTEAPAEISETTSNELARIKTRLTPYANTSAHRKIISDWMKYAAVIALMILSGVSTFLLYNPAAEVVFPQLVEVSLPYGETRQMTLPDGTVVNLNAGTVFIYPQQFDGADRIVYLSGEARFKVAHNPAKPFIVQTHTMDVTALGTTFTVQSYPYSKRSITTLEEGSVQVDIKQEDIASVILKPNEQLLYFWVSNEVHVRQVDAAYFSGWTEGYLIFQDESFDRVMAALERKFHATIHYNIEKYHNSALNVKFSPDETLEDVLFILSRITEGLTYEIKENTVIIY